MTLAPVRTAMVSRASGVLARARAAVDRGIADALHLRVRSRTNRAAFAIVGGLKPRHYYARLYLDERDLRRPTIGWHARSSADGLRGLARDLGMVVFCGSAPPELSDDVVLRAPWMIDLEVTLPRPLDSPDARWSSSAKSNIARAKGFECELSSIPDAFDEFYDRFYVPSMNRRHGSEGIVRSRRSLRGIAASPGAELIRVTRHGAWVGSVLNYLSPFGYHLGVIGWLNGEPELRRTGLLGALYWGSYRRAAALGIGTVQLGGAPAYLESGLLSYKSHWGGRLSTRRTRYGWQDLLLDPRHPDCRCFLERNSLISIAPDGAYVVYSARQPDEIRVASSLRDQVSRWYCWNAAPMPTSGAADRDVPAGVRPWVTPAPR